MHALDGDEVLGALLVAVGVAEGDDGERGAAAGVVDDVAHHAADVAVALGVVEVAEHGGGDALVGERAEHALFAFALGWRVSGAGAYL